MSTLEKLWADKEIVEMYRWCCSTYGHNPMPFSHDQYSSVDDYKEKLRAFVEAEKKKGNIKT